MKGRRRAVLFVQRFWARYTIHFGTIVAEYMAQMCTGQISTVCTSDCQVLTHLPVKSVTDANGSLRFDCYIYDY